VTAATTAFLLCNTGCSIYTSRSPASRATPVVDIWMTCYSDSELKQKNLSLPPQRSALLKGPFSSAHFQNER